MAAAGRGRLPSPVIVVPGITAAYLLDEYPLPPETIWTVLRKDYGRASLHPDNLRFEAKEPARVTPGQLYEVAYEELIEELRFNLRVREDAPVPVFPFSYDWRQPVETAEVALAEFIEEVIERTKLLRHYHDAGYGAAPRVSLVGHSMGGLVVAGYVARFGGARVDRVATLATPYQGSFEAVIKITTGTANLGASPPSSREREAARATPSLYQLLPSFARGLKVAPGLPESLFDPGLWQPSILDTLAEYIRLHGLEPERKRRARARELFAALLAAAAAHRERIDGLRLADAGLGAKDWLCVVGVDAETRVRLQVVKRDGAPDFAFRSRDRDNKWAGKKPAERRNTGDGTVPFEGAVPKFLDLENLVCVSPDDFGYWEWKDRPLAALAGFHGVLPNMNMLHRLIVRHFTGRPDRHGNTWGRLPPGVTKRAWKPPLDLAPKPNPRGGRNGNGGGGSSGGRPPPFTHQP